MAPSTTNTSTAAGINISALPRSPIAAAPGHAAAIRVDDLAVAGRGGDEPVAEGADPRDRDRGHRVADLEGGPGAPLERERAHRSQVHAGGIAPVPLERLPGRQHRLVPGGACR